MRNRIAGFDGLRALAVIAVFLHHRLPTAAGESGFFGVTLFFALSGFLIVNILYRERLAIEAQEQTRDKALQAFLARRTLRIFPIYYLTLTVLAILAVTGLFTTGWNPVGHIFHTFYLSNVWIGSIRENWPGNYSHLWSLSIEEQFYLLTAPVLLLVPARQHLALCLAAVGIGVVTLCSELAMGLKAIAIENNSFINFATIALGGAAGLAHSQGAWRWRGDLLLAIAILILGMNWAALSMAHGWITVPLKVIASPIAALIVALICTSQTGLIVVALEWKPLVHLGRISYGFYLFHNFVAFSLFERPNVVYKLVDLLLGFGTVVILAELSWRFVERPLISLAKARTKSKSVPAAA